MRLGTIAAAIMLSAASLSAQSPVLGTLQYQGDLSGNGQTSDGTQVGPYKANLTGYNDQFGLPSSPATLTDYIVWCVDYNHFTTKNAENYYSTAFSTNTGGIVGDGDFSKTLQNNQSMYQQVAWLIEQYDPASALYSAVNVQATVWNLMGASPLLTGYTDLSGYIPLSITLERDWYVLSDAVIAGIGDHRQPHQEFLASVARPVVPEPSTLLLLTSGIFAIGLAGRRRSKV